MRDFPIAMLRPELIKMRAYASARSENTNGLVRLDANENPWSPIEGSRFNRYPEPQPISLIQEFAKRYQVNEKQILVTRGIDEGIDLLIRACCRAYQDKIVICPPTYGMYEVAANIQGVETIGIPLKKEENFALDSAALQNLRDENIKIIFICSPNNPTATPVALESLVRLCECYQGRALIVVDEAYIEFSPQNSIVSYLAQFSNLVVLRTLSKAYGLAGLRCGVLLAAPDFINILKKVIAPYPIPSCVVETVLIAMSKTQVIQQQLMVIQREKWRLQGFLQSCHFIEKIWKSETNFILFQSNKHRSILEIAQKNGIVMRDRSQDFGLSNCIRVTVGNPSENRLLIEVFKNA